MIRTYCDVCGKLIDPDEVVYTLTMEEKQPNDEVYYPNETWCEEDICLECTKDLKRVIAHHIYEKGITNA